MRGLKDWIAIFLTIIGLLFGGYAYVNARIDDVREKTAPREAIDYIRESIDKLGKQIERMDDKIERFGRCR